MIPALANHLWQSTLCSVVAGLLTLMLRRNHARIRHSIWLAASVKFLVPFSLLVAAGSQLQRSGASPPPPQLKMAMEEISQPFTMAGPRTTSAAVVHLPPTQIPTILLMVWLCGFSGLVFSWGLRSRRVRSGLRGALPLDLSVPITTLSSAACVEPGVFGVFRPVLVLPEGIAERLTPKQLATIVAHELCHVRRRDNLVGAIHMVVEALFWFHPLVWWIGARLIDERERACDEEVLGMGSDPQVYAEGILTVCKFYVESRLPCVAGVAGSDLRKRIEGIMMHRNSHKLNFARRLLLAAAAFGVVATPMFIGIVNPAQSRAQLQGTPIPFEVAAVKANKSNERAGLQALPGGTLTITNAPLNIIVMLAYGLPGNATSRISGLPKWAESERFDINAKAVAGAIPAGLKEKQLNEKSRLLLQSVLAGRFGMTTHWETREAQVYVLTVGKNGLKLPKAKIEEKDCPETPTRDLYCHRFMGGQGPGLHGKTINMADLVDGLQQWTDHPVIDRTGVQGLYDIDTEGWVPMNPRIIPPGTERTEAQAAEDRAFADPGRPTLQHELEKVGIKMEAAKGPVQILVIDNIERPLEN
jgi:uncharacterized protein (TIGR03435 family)